ncbi:unnamed protein product [Urochloa humidicola]
MASMSITARGPACSFLGGHDARFDAPRPPPRRQPRHPFPADFADLARGETSAHAAVEGIVESVGARDPSCSSTGEDDPYNGAPAVSSSWENGTDASPREATRRPSAGQAGG